MPRSSSTLARRRSPRRDPMPLSISPMLATAGDLPPDPDHYNFEWKWDGIRALCLHDGRALRLRSRNQIDITARYPELQSLAAALAPHRAILDGEIVALDDLGRPSFAQLQRRMHVTDPAAIARLVGQVPILYVLFDLLYLDDRSLMPRPYHDRRTALEQLTIAGPHWQMTAAHINEGVAMLATARQTGLEGVVAKRLDSPYEPAKRSPAWIKIKVVQRQEFIIAGWIPEVASDHHRIGSLLLGYHDAAGRLHYAGRVGTGLNADDHASLTKLFARHVRSSSPFHEKVPGAAVHFLTPTTVAEIEFRRWPDNGLVQQGAFKGVRFDKDPRQVIKERITPANLKR